jgi:hypothetical protein
MVCLAGVSLAAAALAAPPAAEATSAPRLGCTARTGSATSHEREAA